MKALRLIVIGLALLLYSCASYKCKTYYIPDKSRNKVLTVNICPKTVVKQKFQEYIKKGYVNITNTPDKPPGTISEVVGFYLPDEHVIFSIPDWETLLHEFWHAMGNLEEPYWEVKKK